VTGVQTCALPISRLIRDDAVEGSAVLTATASAGASFTWTVDAPDGLLDLRHGRGENTVAFGDGRVPDSPDGGLSEVFLTILRVLRDPGATGTMVRVRIAAELDGLVIEQEIELTVVRPAGELAVSISPSASRVGPRSTVTLVATVSGGSPFLSTGGTRPNCDSDAISTDDENPPYCISWTVNETGLNLNGATGGTTRTDDLDGADADKQLGTGDSGEALAGISYTAPLNVGTVTFRVDVTDRSGNRQTESIAITVDSNVALSIAEASSNAGSSEGTDLAPGDQSTLTVRAVDGEGPYTVEFEILNGNVRGGVISSSSCSISGLEMENGCEISYTAPSDDVGTELVRVTVIDSVGARESTIISIPISSPQSLAVTLASDFFAISPTQSTSIDAKVSGGTPPYDICYEDRKSVV